MRKSIREMDSLLKDFQRAIQREKSVLQTVDLEIRDVGAINYNFTTPIPIYPTPDGRYTKSGRNPWKKLGIQPNYAPVEGQVFASNQGHLSNPGNFGERPFNPSKPHYIPNNDAYSASLARPPPLALDSYNKYVSFDAPYSPRFPIFGLPTTLASRVLVAASQMQEKSARQRIGYLPGGRLLTRVNRMPPTTHHPQQAARTLSKAQAWVRNKQWTKTPTQTTQQAHIRQGPDTNRANPEPESVVNPIAEPVLDVKPPAIPVLDVESAAKPVLDVKSAVAPVLVVNSTAKPVLLVNSTDRSLLNFSMPALTDIIPKMSIPGLNEAKLTKAAAGPTPTPTRDPLAVDTTKTMSALTEELFHEDEQGFLYVTSPVTIPEAVTEITTSTFGLVLLNADQFTASTAATVSHQQLHELMATRDEGYLVVFLLELARLVAYKTPRHAAEILAHIEIVYNRMYEQGALAHYGEPIVEAGIKVSRIFSGNTIDVVQSQANMMHQMLGGRTQFLSAEVNSIIDYADMMYEDDEGEALFEALRKFEAYPDSGESSYDVCYNLIDKFLKPYVRLKKSSRLRKLLDSVNKVVVVKFGHRRAAAPTIKLNQPRKKKNQQRHQPQSLRKRLEKKRHRIKRTRRQQYKNRRRNEAVPRLRSLLPITQHQRRFRVVTPRHLRTNGYLNMLRPTVDYFRSRVGKPVHPNSGVQQLFPVEMEYRRHGQITAEETRHLPEQTLGTVMNEYKRITQDSSYSDEEAALRMHLRRALRLNWHKTSTKTSLYYPELAAQ